MNIFKKIIRRLFHRPNPDKEAMDYAYAHGFRSGKNFHYYSGFPIDANLPWLISVGDNVTLATGAKLLAHDASTPVPVYIPRSVLYRLETMFSSVQILLFCATPESATMLLLVPAP